MSRETCSFLRAYSALVMIKLGIGTLTFTILYTASYMALGFNNYPSSAIAKPLFVVTIFITAVTFSSILMIPNSMIASNTAIYIWPTLMLLTLGGIGIIMGATMVKVIGAILVLVVAILVLKRCKQ